MYTKKFLSRSEADCHLDIRSNISVPCFLRGGEGGLSAALAWIMYQAPPCSRRRKEPAPRSFSLRACPACARSPRSASSAGSLRSPDHLNLPPFIWSPLLSSPYCWTQLRPFRELVGASWHGASTRLLHPLHWLKQPTQGSSRTRAEGNWRSVGEVAVVVSNTKQQNGP